LGPEGDLLDGGADIAEVRQQDPLVPLGHVSAVSGDEPVVGAVERALEADIPKGAVAGGVAGEDDVDVDAGPVHRLGAGARVPAHLERRDLTVRPGRPWRA